MERIKCSKMILEFPAGIDPNGVDGLKADVLIQLPNGDEVEIGSTRNIEMLVPMTGKCYANVEFMVNEIRAVEKV